MHKRALSFLLPLALALSAPLASAVPADLRLAFPAPGSGEVCPDAQLRLVLPAAASAGAAGTIAVHDAADGRAVASIDVAAPSAVQALGGLPGFRYQALTLDGREVSLRLPCGALAYSKTYYVTVAAGALASGGAPVDAVSSPNAWRFTTRSRPPAPGRPVYVVAADGSGDFCTVQGALDFIPAGNTAPVTLLLRRGLYRETVFFTDRHAVTLLGEDRRGTVIACANNANFNASGGNPFAGARPDPSAARPKAGGSVYRRGMILAHRVDDFAIANLTLRNTTPQGGSQAEALILNGTASARAILREVDLYSFQDTLQINGQAYVRDCTIEGDVDFMWGTGPVYLENCHARTVRSGAYFTQIRNSAAGHGYVFVRCLFDGLPGVTGNLLSRIEPDRFPHSEVVLLDCTLGEAVSPVGWMLQVKKGVAEPPTPDLHFWESGSVGEDGRPVDFSRRHGASRRLDPVRDAGLVSRYRDPRFVLGGDWNPSKSPLLARPIAESVAAAKALAGIAGR